MSNEKKTARRKSLVYKNVSNLFPSYFSATSAIWRLNVSSQKPEHLRGFSLIVQGFSIHAHAIFASLIRIETAYIRRVHRRLAPIYLQIVAYDIGQLVLYVKIDE